MKVTVFGGAGFLGSHVADELTNRGHDVLIFDKNPSAYIQKNQQIIVNDIMDFEAVKKAVKGSDVVYNFVALADIEQAHSNPFDTVKYNILGNINVLEACKEAGVKRYVFSSSVYIYSDKGSFYRCSKQSAELFIENYQKIHGLDYTILRYGSLYGLRSGDNNWIYRILKQALLEGKITREGSGEEIREYIHVLDAARLSVDILNDSYRNRCVMITGNEQMKIKDLLLMIREMLKGKIDIEYLPVKISEHYEITPYVYNPKIATKLSASEYIDMGQGMIDILGHIHQKHSSLVKQSIYN